MKIVWTFVALLLAACSATDFATESKVDQVKVEAYSPVYPLLIGKQYNPVFRFNINMAQRSNAAATKVGVDLSGTDDLSAIKSLQLFYSGGDEDFRSELLLGSMLELSEKGEITIEKPVIPAKGNNYFWLSVNLNDNADLLNKVSVKATTLYLGDNAIAVSDADNGDSKRIGHAFRKRGDDGVNAYRIPGLETTNKGTLIAVYDIRHNSSRDLQGNIDIGMRRSTDGGQTWSPMNVIMDMGEWGGLPQDQNGVGDPAILVDRETNTIWVAALWSHGHPGEMAWFASKPGLVPTATGQFMLVKSEDDGVSWSDLINITDQVKNPDWQLMLDGPGKGISLTDGTLVFPAQFKDGTSMPYSTLIYSKDHGKSWKSGTGAKSDTTEAQVVELADGALMLNMRDNRGNGPSRQTGTGARAVATTTDLGQTWVTHATSNNALPEPVCQASLVTHTIDGEDSILLFSNPNDQFSRRNMTIKISTDNGMSWPQKYHTLIDEGTGWGYSSLTSIDEQTIGILYEGSQANLVFQKIRLNELIEK